MAISSLAKTLQIKPGMQVLACSVPADISNGIEPLPDGAAILKRAGKTELDGLQLFAKTVGEFDKLLGKHPSKLKTGRSVVRGLLQKEFRHADQAVDACRLGDARRRGPRTGQNDLDRRNLVLSPLASEGPLTRNCVNFVSRPARVGGRWGADVSCVCSPELPPDVPHTFHRSWPETRCRRRVGFGNLPRS